MNRAIALCALLLVAIPVLLPVRAAAQVPWESPQLLAPHSPAGLGLYFAGYGSGSGDGLGAVLTRRSAPAPGFGFRAGFARGIDRDPAIAGGMDVSAWLAHASPTFPLDVIWTSGAGLGAGEYFHVAVPMGIAAGRGISQTVRWFNPYVSARVVVEAAWGDDAPVDPLDVALATDIGADIAFDREGNFIIRLAASFGERNAFVLGAHSRFGLSSTP